MLVSTEETGGEYLIMGGVVRPGTPGRLATEAAAPHQLRGCRLGMPTAVITECISICASYGPSQSLCYNNIMLLVTPASKSG